MKTSKQGKDLIKKYEGCRLKAYKPVPTEKYWTIGWGHYGPDVKAGQVITQQQADKIFDADLPKYEGPVNNLGMNLNQNEFDALVSFCYNCGAGNLSKLCSSKNKVRIAQVMPLYNKGGGKVLAGLTRRRNEEVALFKRPVKSTVKQPLKDSISSKPNKGGKNTIKVTGVKNFTYLYSDKTCTKAVAKLPKNSKLSYIGVTGSLYKGKYQGKVGYVRQKYCTLEK